MVTVVASIVLALAIPAEYLHLRKCLVVARMAFAEQRQGLFVVFAAGSARVTGVTLTAVALALLWQSSFITRNAIGAIADDAEMDRMIVVMDASKSMNLEDAGPDGSETRATRARNLIYQLISRANRFPRTTLMTFGDRVLPVVCDAQHWDVLANVLLRQYYSRAFDSTDTEIDGALESSLDIAKDWVPKSTIVVLLTDGESKPTVKEFHVPNSVRHVLVLGVGSSEGRAAGPNLADISRRDDANLRRIANLTGGDYFNCNKDPLPVAYIDALLPAPPEAVPPQSHRDLPLALLAIGAAVLALVPIALSFSEKRLLQP
jgi:Ca-activated chloride channel family protein